MSEDAVGDAVSHLVVGVDDGSGREDVDDAPLRGDYIDGAPSAGVGGKRSLASIVINL